MPGKIGVLSLRGDLQKSYECEKEAITYASSNRLPDASGEVLAAAQQLSQSGMEILMKKVNQSAPKPLDSVGIKTIQLHESDPSKTALIGIELGDK